MAETQPQDTASSPDYMQAKTGIRTPPPAEPDPVANVNEESERQKTVTPQAPIDQQKNWTEISIDPRYRAMPEEDQKAVAKAYFDRVVFPQAISKMRSGFVGAKMGGSPAPELQDDYIKQKAWNEFQGAVQITKGDNKKRVPDVDYYSGIGNNKVLGDLANDENDRERFKTLSRYYGKNNVKVDPGGRFYVTLPGKDGQSGKKVAVYGVANTEQQAWANFKTGILPAAGFVASSFLAPQFTVIGEVAPELTEAAPFLEKAAKTITQLMKRAEVAGIGGAGGHAGNEVIKATKGDFDQTFSEVSKNLVREGIDSAVANAEFDVTLNPIGNLLRTFYAKGASPEERQIAKDALAMGLRPSISQLRQQTQGAKIWGIEQQFFETITNKGAKFTNQNMDIVGKMVDDQLRAVGIPEADIAKIKQKIFNKQLTPMMETEDARTYARKLGEKTKQALEDYTKEAQMGLTKRAEELLKQSSGDTHAALAQDFTKAVVDYRKSISSVATQKYAALDAEASKFLPDGLTVDTTPLKQQAYAMKEELLRQKAEEGKKIADIVNPQGEAISTVKSPSKEKGKVVADLASQENLLNTYLNLPDRVPVKQMMSYRTNAFDKADPMNLTPDTSKGFWKRIANAADQSIEGMEKDPKLLAGGNVPKDFLAKLRDTRKWYRSEMEKMDRVVVNKIAKEAGTSGAWREGVLSEMLIKPDNAAEMRYAKSVVPQKIWQRVANLRLNTIFHDSLDAGGVLESGKLSGQIRRFSDEDLKEAFGDKTAKELRTLQNQSYSLAGHLDPATLDESNLSESIRAAKAQKEASDKFWNENIVKKLAEGGEGAEAATKEVISMNSLEVQKKVRDFYGPESKQWDNIKQQAMIEFLSEGMSKSSSGFMSLNGEAWQQAFERRGYENVKDMWGKDVADGMQKLIKWTRYAVDPRKVNMTSAGVGMAAMNFALHLPHHLLLWMASPVVGNLYRSPTYIKWLTEGLEGNSIKAQLAAKLFRLSMYEFEKSVNATMQMGQSNMVPGYVGMGAKPDEWQPQQ